MQPSIFLSLLLVAAASASCHLTSTTNTSSHAATSQSLPPDAPLRETRWVLRQLGSKPIVVSVGGQEPYLLLRATNAAEGQGSCNRFRGTASVDSVSQLIFSPLLSMRMACPALATEQEFTQALAATHSYRISGDTLRLYAAPTPGSTPLAQLEAVRLR